MLLTHHTWALSRGFTLAGFRTRAVASYQFQPTTISYDVLSTPMLLFSSGPTTERPHRAASCEWFCLCILPPFPPSWISLRNGPQLSRARDLCAAEENLFRF